MTPELQVIVDRIELVERQNRGLRTLAVIAVAVALVAIVLPFLQKRAPEDRTRFSVVEANRFLLRGPEGQVSGGLETTAGGDIRLVLGSQGTAAAFLEVQSNGVAHLSLRSDQGDVRAAMVGGRVPAVSLSPGGAHSSAALSTLPDGSGALLINDARGRVRYRIP